MNFDPFYLYIFDSLILMIEPNSYYVSKVDQNNWIIECMIILNWIKIYHEAGPIFSQEK